MQKRFLMQTPIVEEWHVYLGGDPGFDLDGAVSMIFPEGRQPNRFYRFMQWLVLGIYWRKVIR